ncbi:hypothetical protein L6164_020267 [Bauhinia variegata]|uniref:Uncharacterized protein n=1 Tax=Bauhinia variegata TaxID=167791 RepID=A0ACB9MVB6_BAUVA|nr:hypothetical protein L6164_020267 [Bauhinia variegata]
MSTGKPAIANHLFIYVHVSYFLLPLNESPPPPFPTTQLWFYHLFPRSHFSAIGSSFLGWVCSVMLESSELGTTMCLIPEKIQAKKGYGFSLISKRTGSCDLYIFQVLGLA